MDKDKNDKHPGGRPVIYTPEVIEEIKQKIIAYTDETEIPIVAEFAFLNDIRKATLYEIEELSYYIKRMMEKKEFVLEKKGYDDEANTTMVVFSLKQLGWTDKHDIDLSGAIHLVLDGDDDTL